MKITFLGTAGAIPTATRTNTSLWIDSEIFSVMIDCSGDIYHKIKKYELNPNKLEHVIITHEHIDHSFGLPSLLETLRLSGREKELHIHIQEKAFDKIKQILSLNNLLNRHDGFPVIFHSIPMLKNYSLLNDGKLKIHTTPVKHLVPTVAVSITDEFDSITYSSDTEPVQDVVELARKSAVLIHESTTARCCMEPVKGHTSADDAARIAKEAGVDQLFLVHILEKVQNNKEAVLHEAEEHFSGKVIIPDDGYTFDIKDVKIRKV